MGMLPETIITDLRGGGQVKLQPITPCEAAPIFPYPQDALEFLPPTTQHCLSSEREGMSFIQRHINSPYVAAAGVFAANGELAGVASWVYTPREIMRNSVSYGIYLSRRRGEGIGRMTTAGMVALGLLEGALECGSRLPTRPAALITYIHPENIASQTICEGSGLADTGGRDGEEYKIHALMHPVDSGRELRYDGMWLFGDELRKTSAARVGALAERYEVEVEDEKIDWRDVLAPRATGVLSYLKK